LHVIPEPLMGGDPAAEYNTLFQLPPTGVVISSLNFLNSFRAGF